MKKENIQRVGIIGNGNVAWHLSVLFASAGITVSGILVRNMSKAKLKQLDQQFSAPLFEDIEALRSCSDMIMIAVSDNHVLEVAANLRGFKGIAVHTSGAVPLAGLAAFCPDSGVFYPLQTLTKGKLVAPDDIPFCIESTNPETGKRLLNLAVSIGSPAVRMDSGQRLLVHVAAVLACNFPNHLYLLARKVMQAGHADYSLLLPLIRETTGKIQAIDPFDAQTGPALRGDQETLAKHFEVLKDLPEIQGVYRELTRSIIEHHKNQ
ncbi:MAG: DUF2520 domain-containing protein [Bacteroidales bacterium]